MVGGAAREGCRRCELTGLPSPLTDSKSAATCNSCHLLCNVNGTCRGHGVRCKRRRQPDVPRHRAPTGSWRLECSKADATPKAPSQTRAHASRWAACSQHGLSETPVRSRLPLPAHTRALCFVVPSAFSSFNLVRRRHQHPRHVVFPAHGLARLLDEGPVLTVAALLNAVARHVGRLHKGPLATARAWPRPWMGRSTPAKVFTSH